MSADLKRKVDAGTMIKSITQIAGGGYRIEFTSGSLTNVSNTGGSVTDIRIGDNTNWYIDGVDNGMQAEGRSADGIDGATDEDGIDGADGEDGKDGDTMIAAIVNNDDAHTEYTFRKASTAVSIAILNAGTLGIAQEQSGVLQFAVNPSNTYISTDIADWMLCDVNIGAAPANLTLERIVYDGIAGQYTATIRRNAALETVAALKLDTGTAGSPSWVSSSAFRISIALKIALTVNGKGFPRTQPGRSFGIYGTGTATINWGDGTEPVTLTLIKYTGFLHTYNDGVTTHHITIDGGYITVLNCYNNHVDGTFLTSLDVSGCIALYNLRIQSNNFNVPMLNAPFRTLHGNYITGRRKTVFIGDSPGTSGCDKNIAILKGWPVNTG